MHFSGLKAVGESVSNPLAYYDNNISGSLTLYKAMAEAQVYKLVFSSSATVYGDPQQIPIDEMHPTGAVTNPYGQTKYMNELICADLVRSNPKWNIGILRYFNPIGAHASGLIGEDPNDIPNNLMPYILQVTSGKLKELSVFGNDWPTHDGTGVRDYIHVVDLAKAHLSCLEKLNSKFTGLNTWNVGTGKGYSVLEIVNAFEAITGIKIPYKITPRREGDIAECWADTSKASKELDWQAESDLKQMIQDAWNWQSKNPQGYSS
jgi:UDP-glucose 4-epimerase